MSELRSEVAGSKLNWLWWIIEPISLSLIYIFIVQVIFSSQIEYVGVFVLIGQTLWLFFDKNIRASVKVIKSNKSIISKVYIPKYILLMVKITTLLFKMSISSTLIVVLMFVYKVNITWNALYFFPIIVTLLLFVLGATSILAHYGVYTNDLVNVLNIILKFMFYLTGIFYSVTDRIPGIYGQILGYANPMAYFIGSLRGCLLYGIQPNLYIMASWFIISLIMCYTGLKLINKYENSYAKVV